MLSGMQVQDQPCNEAWVGDRSMIERALDTISGEFAVLDRTLSDMLADPAKVE